MTKTTDFESFSEPELTSHERKAVTGTLPVYAKTDEASVYKLDEDEYIRFLQSGTDKTCRYFSPDGGEYEIVRRQN